MNAEAKAKCEKFDWVQDLGQRPFPKDIDKRLLKCDDKYQREHTVNKCRTIARNFSWLAFMRLLVSERKSGYYIIDGGNRHGATMLRPDITDVPCDVLVGLSTKQEAAIYKTVNRFRIPMKGLELWKAMLAAGDVVAHETKKTCEGYGFQVGRGKTTDAIAYIGGAMNVVRMHESGVLDDVLMFISNCWSESNLRATNIVLHGCDKFRATLKASAGKSLLDDDVIARFAQISLANLFQDAQTEARLRQTAGAEGFRLACIAAFNKGRRTGKIGLVQQ